MEEDALYAEKKNVGKREPRQQNNLLRNFKDKFSDSNIDLSQYSYIKWNIPSVAICRKHDKFNITPNNLLQGYGCKQCGIENSAKTRTKSKECVCNGCRKEKVSKLLAKHKEDFVIEYYNKFPNTNYDFSKFQYVNNHTNSIVICPIHGEFQLTPIHLLRGQGCKKCNISKMENEIKQLLIENKIQFEEQKRFEWLGYQSLDFYLPKHKIAIECQGEQHFKPIKHFGGEKALTENKERDERKLKLCNENGIKLLYYANYNYNFPYKVITDKNQLLQEIKVNKSI